MDLIQPPPLPDLPLARRATSSPPPMPFPSLARESAPAGAGLRVLLLLPLPVVAIASSLLLSRAYRSGEDFRHEVSHDFVKFFDTLVFGAAVGVTLLAAVVALCCAWRRLSGRVRPLFVALLILSGILAGGALGAARRTFRAGKAAAYARVDPALLVQDCLSLAAARAASRPTSTPVTTRPSSANPLWLTRNDPRLPPYVRSLRPRHVVVADTHVRVIMAVTPFSGVHEEGFYVPLSPAADPHRDVGPHTALSAEPAVLRYGW